MTQHLEGKQIIIACIILLKTAATGNQITTKFSMLKEDTNWCLGNVFLSVL